MDSRLGQTLTIHEVNPLNIKCASRQYARKALVHRVRDMGRDAKRRSSRRCYVAHSLKHNVVRLERQKKQRKVGGGKFRVKNVVDEQETKKKGQPGFKFVRP